IQILQAGLNAVGGQKSVETHSKIECAESTPQVSIVREDLGRIQFLEELLSRRDASIDRLNQEISSFRSQQSLERDERQRVQFLQSKVQRLEIEVLSFKEALFGRVLAIYPRFDNKGFILALETFDGERRLIEGDFFSSMEPSKIKLDLELSKNSVFPVQSEFVEGEWVMVRPYGEEKNFVVTSMERKGRKELVGYVEECSDGFRLISEDGPIPIFFGGDKSCLQFPAAGIYLPEVPQRPAGVYSFRKLSIGQEKPKYESDLTFPRIQAFLGLLRFNHKNFIQLLKDNEISHAIKGEKIHFEDDYRRVLSSLRSKISVRAVCDREECRKKLLEEPFVRLSRNDESCSVCLEVGEEIEKINFPQKYDFRKASILIAGGDVVGSRYQEAMAEFNLNVRWVSGYHSIGGLGEGLGNVELLVIILKQISHTVLRELLVSAKFSKTKVVFSPKRGVSGLLKLISGLIRSS
ncbi:hypothetical protein HYY75_09170, partial [bacterium]|nr:hypothetical protein [bacterium]